MDVVLGSIISSLFIADFLQVQLPLTTIIALAICVWLIYTADHLSDALSIPHEAHTSRHRFHQKYIKTVRIFFFIVSATGLFLLSQLPLRLIIWGSFVLGIVGLYFISIRWLKLQYIVHKEIVIALLYSVGIFLAPVYFSTFPLKITVIILFIEYIFIAFINLILFSWYEKTLDEQDNHISFVTLVGERKAKKTLIFCLYFLYGVIILSTLLNVSEPIFIFTQVILLLMTLTLHGVLSFPAYFRQHERYRGIADAIFLYPILYLLL